MPTIPQLYDTAVLRHARGELAEAEGIYRQILSADPDHADALHNLGLLAMQLGDLQTGAALITQSIHRAGPRPQYCMNLAQLFLYQGEADKAAACYRQAVASEPRQIEARLQLARLCRDAGDHNTARRHIHDVIRIDPKNGVAFYELGTLYYQSGQSKKATAQFRRAIYHAPGLAEAHYNLGVTFLQVKPDDARRYFEQAIALKAHYPEAYLNLSILARLKKRFDEAIRYAERAAQQAPESGRVWHNLGAAYRESGRLLEAESAYRESMRLEGEHPDTLLDLSSVLLGFNRVPESLALARKLITQQPERPEAHWNASLCHLVAGNWKEGWEEHEWRLRDSSSRVRSFPQPRWKGETPNGRRILLHAEQGLGDTIQFARYAPLVSAMGAEVTLAVYPSLIPLLKTMESVADVVSVDGPYPPFDFHLQLMSLPRVFETTPDSVPSPQGYLSTDARRVDQWRQRLADLAPTGKRVGIVWAGNPNHRNDANRSMQPEDLAELSGTQGVTFFSLQKDATPEQLSRIPSELGLIDLASEIRDFADTAAAVSALDLVVAVDTSVAHLAGALGAPVWLLLPFAPDWRWMLDRADTPWYSSMRIFRQRSRKDWSSVLGDVKDALRALGDAGAA